MRTENPGTPLHICHLTVLNPVQHSRIYEKEAISQRAAGFKVTVVGQGDAGKRVDAAGIELVGFPGFGRLSWGRFRSRKRILQAAKEIRADVYQVHTPELLDVAEELKQELPGSRIIYDMHEDYYLNLRFGGYISPILKGRLSNFVRKKEIRAAAWLDGVFYAEKCFRGILPIHPDKSITVENKFKAPPGWPSPGWESGRRASPENPMQLVFTGTVAENWGIMRSLELVRELNQHHPTGLKVIGQIHDADLGQQIQEFVTENQLEKRVNLQIGKTYVPHVELLETIRKNHVGTAFYQLRENLKDRIPTKFYEHMALQRPLLFTDNPAWNKLNDRIGFGMPVKFPLADGQVKAIADRIAEGWEIPPINKKEWSWESEEKEDDWFPEKMGRREGMKQIFNWLFGGVKAKGFWLWMMVIAVGKVGYWVVFGTGVEPDSIGYLNLEVGIYHPIGYEAIAGSLSLPKRRSLGIAVF